ncbi:Transposable element Tc1 transposase [Labeo rohita]|uniref:Transposable element Tc1 transposase n=1 Tax=Labeo rohita TaxID=84645 RepID=A0ABQ8M9X8_LABRO|nr:Transposable element Tc1 transposase [Labeo rohita]
MVSQFGSLGYTIMGKTADLTVVQKTIIDILHKEGKPQTFIAKEAGCSQSAVSKHVNRKLSGRTHTTHRRVKEFGYSCRIPLVKPFLNHRHIRGVLPGLRRRRSGLLPSGPKSSDEFSDESKFCISFGNQGRRVWRKCGEAHSPSCLKFPQSVMIWGAVSSAGVGPLCFLKRKSLHPFTKKF